MIQGYATPSSLFPGEEVTIRIHVIKVKENEEENKQETKFCTYFFRAGETWEYQGVSPVWTATPGAKPSGITPKIGFDPTKGIDYPDQSQIIGDPLAGSDPITGVDPTKDWNWPGNAFRIPDTWPSGAYTAVFVKGDKVAADGIGIDPDDPQYEHTRTLFVVKSANPGQNASILYKIPLFTYCAYNFEGYVSLYAITIVNPTNTQEAKFDDRKRNFKVTLHRVGCGLGGDPFDRGVSDVYDISTPRQTFPHWDQPFISWLESNGYKVDYCTDLDIHRNANDFLSKYRLLLSVGHDEYWSTEMRDHVDSFIANGGNVAFFSGNTCWWCVHLTESDTAFTCDKAKHEGDDQPYDQWMRIRPETKLTGVSYINAGGWWSDTRDPVGFTVQSPEHWVYAGTNLKKGDVFGKYERLIGYECDGAKMTDDSYVSGNFVASHPDKSPDESPKTFQILGVGLLGPNWGGDDEKKERRGGDHAAATMGVWGGEADQGTVFTAATTDWARVLLASGVRTRKVVDRITHNVLDKLSSPNVAP
jgi:hypothetical protein